MEKRWPDNVNYIIQNRTQNVCCETCNAAAEPLVQLFHRVVVFASSAFLSPNAANLWSSDNH